jgi:hypothetical protein
MRASFEYQEGTSLKGSGIIDLKDDTDIIVGISLNTSWFSFASSANFSTCCLG